MRILVLGGTAFLSRTIAETARDAGHAVTCATRGVSGRPPDGVEYVQLDRDEPEGLAVLADSTLDAVIDIERQSVTRVRRAIAVLAERVGHWTYVSSTSVYADAATPGQVAVDAPLLSPAPEDADESDSELYGRLKVACEGAVRSAVGDRALICRAGLIVGPRDGSDRFGYWPARLARGGEVLVPGAPEDFVQYVDVRDLSEWIVRCAGDRIVGTYDGIGQPLPWAEVIDAMASAVGGPDLSFTWVPGAWLGEQDVAAWAGPDSLPLWLPMPDYAGFLTRDTSPSVQAGLTTRSTEDIAVAALDWERVLGLDRDRRSGITPEREAALLAAWRETN